VTHTLDVCLGPIIRICRPSWEAHHGNLCTCDVHGSDQDQDILLWYRSSFLRRYLHRQIYGTDAQILFVMSAQGVVQPSHNLVP
jgi:hypothetical protein